MEMASNRKTGVFSSKHQSEGQLFLLSQCLAQSSHLCYSYVPVPLVIITS
ncbi:hypothetical protein LEMLEM_LOCUS27309 [Lemmus lemmus]